jgi:uncharacterized protein (TIGR02466 family)
MNNIELSKHVIWPTCIFTTQWNDHATHAVAIQKNIDEWVKTEPESKITRNVKKNLYESKFNFLNQEDESIVALSTFMAASIFEVCKNMNDGLWIKNNNYGVDITESWFHVTKNYGYHDVHSHPMNSWSGIYYLNIGDTQIETNNGINRFYAPFNQMYLDRGNQYMTNIWDLDPKNGMLVIFPAHLLHSALPYLGKNPRYVIAFNARVEDAV